MNKNNYRRDVWGPLRARAGLAIRFHDLRHTCATLLLAAGVNIKAVSARLGHASVQLTLDTYAHVMPSDEERIAQLTGELFDASAAADSPTIAPRTGLSANGRAKEKPRKS